MGGPYALGNFIRRLQRKQDDSKRSVIFQNENVVAYWVQNVAAYWVENVVAYRVQNVVAYWVQNVLSSSLLSKKLFLFRTYSLVKIFVVTADIYIYIYIYTEGSEKIYTHFKKGKNCAPRTTTVLP